ncbi:MAG: flippase-like domain-containing protein [Chloroflexi bacterium]|nr:flippase-like domain-containing protein [Chloroflexota bacterium]
MNDGLPSTAERPRQRTRFARLQAWIGILLSLACLVWLVYVCARDWADVRAALAQVDYGLVIAATLLNLASVPLRAFRWRLMFPASHVPPFGRLTAALLIGQAVNVLSPARLGDVARATLADTDRTAYALGTLMVEFILDLLMLVASVLFLLLVGLEQSVGTLPAWWRGSEQILLIAGGAALAMVAVVVIGRRRLARTLERLATRWEHPAIHRVVTWANQLLLSLDTLGQTSRLLPVLLCSALIWVLYGAVNYTLLGAVGVRPSVLAALFLLIVLQIGVAVPSSPGRIGVFHYLCVQALAVFGIGGANALSYAFILHLISVILPVAMGAVLSWRLGVMLWRAPANPTTAQQG